MNRYTFMAKVVVCLLLIETNVAAFFNWKSCFFSTGVFYLRKVSPESKLDYRLTEPRTLPDQPPLLAIFHQAKQSSSRWEFRYNQDQAIQMNVEFNSQRRWPDWDTVNYNVLAWQMETDKKIAFLREYSGRMLKTIYMLCFDEQGNCVGGFVLYWNT